jgi:ABC-type branched-subunit amino acid transport system substrate-binding protein
MQGDQSIIGRQMLAGVENYLKEYKHLVIGSDDTAHSIILKHLKNNPLPNSSAITALPTTSPIIFGATGLNNIKKLIPLIDQHKALLLFPIEGDSSLRQEKHENIIYFRPSYKKELNAIVDYVVNLQHKTNIAIFYESSDWGSNQLDTLTELLAAYNITPVAQASYVQKTVETDDAIKIISKATPNCIICLSQPRAAYSFVSNALNNGLHECLFAGLSQLAVIQKLLKTARGLDVAVTSVVPNTQHSTLPIVAEYKKVMDSFLLHHDDSPFYLETFITMTLLEECLKKITGPITIPAIIKTCELFDKNNFKGLKIAFNQTDRSLSSAIWINPGIDKKWIAY